MLYNTRFYTFLFRFVILHMDLKDVFHFLNLIRKTEELGTEPIAGFNDQ